jgi:hypothetical protein
VCTRGSDRALLRGPSTSPLGVTGSAVPGPNDIAPPDGPLTPEEQAVADSLSADVVARIDAALLSQARKSQRKVAMLVGLTMMDPTLRVPGLPDVFYAQRVKALVQRGLLIAAGNLDYMGYCEVRLP